MDLSLTSVPGKGMKEIILSTNTLYVQDNQEIRPSHHEFVEGRSCLIKLISYDSMICLVDEKKTVNVVYLGIKKVSYAIKSTTFSLGNCLLMTWMEVLFDN